MIKRIRKRPVEVDGVQLNLENINEVADWCVGYVAVNEDNLSPSIRIATLEGTMRAEIGDWIIKGVNGEFYPCKPDIFHKTYDIVLESSPQVRGLQDRIYVESVIEHEDGSATINIDLDQELLSFFAKIGLRKIITEAVEDILKDEDQ